MPGTELLITRTRPGYLIAAAGGRPVSPVAMCSMCAAATQFLILASGGSEEKPDRAEFPQQIFVLGSLLFCKPTQKSLGID